MTATLVRNHEYPTTYNVFFGNRLVMAEESHTVCSLLVDMLNGLIPVTGEVGECAESITANTAYPSQDSPNLTAYRVHLANGTNYATSMAKGVTLGKAREYFRQIPDVVKVTPA